MLIIIHTSWLTKLLELKIFRTLPENTMDIGNQHSEIDRLTVARVLVITPIEIIFAIALTDKSNKQLIRLCMGIYQNNAGEIYKKFGTK